MLVLPNTPPLPFSSEFTDSFSASLHGKRSGLINIEAKNLSDSVRFVTELESYLKDLVNHLVTLLSLANETEFSKTAAELVVCNSIPWKSLRFPSKKSFNLKSPKDDLKWTYLDETIAVLLSVSLINIKLAADLSNELIDTEVNAETVHKWKQVVNFYKWAYSYSMFGQKIVTDSLFHNLTFTLVDKILDISIQMSILSKSSWINRNSDEPTQLNNNGTLARVAIFIADELKNLKNLITSFTSNVSLDSSSWLDYLSIIERYNTAYACEFLSIEYYQQNKLGQAIGLIEFSLLTLQCKNMGESNSKISKVLNKVQLKKGESILKKLSSISSLRVDKTMFNEKSGVILNDLSYLFDELIKLRFKYTKENNNLVFDQVVSWKDINKDSKWPTACKIPVTAIEPFDPFSMDANKIDSVDWNRGYY